jgi:hypothetical protein
MIPWEYDGSKYRKDDYELIPEGEYPVKIREARETTSRNGNPMITMKLNVVDMPQYGTLYYNVTFDPTYPGMTNQQLGRIFDSFDITPGNLDTYTWVGCEGVARVKHGEYNGKMRGEVRTFAPREDDGNVNATSAQQKKSQTTKKNSTKAKNPDDWDFEEIDIEPADFGTAEIIEEDVEVPF